jgi:neutral ceramidase
MLKDSTAASGFVAAFSQSSVGDTTPNVLGAYCDDGSALECGTTEHSTCNGVSTDCHGRGLLITIFIMPKSNADTGPAFQKLDLGVSSCYEIGTRVYTGAKALYVSTYIHLMAYRTYIKQDSLNTIGTAVTDPSVKFYHVSLADRLMRENKY